MNFNPRKLTTESGKNILIGRNSQENNHLTLKIAKPEDLFLHATDFPGSHVILQLRGEEPTRKEILKAAAAAAYYSKGKNKENVKVDYTFKKYVKKPRKAPAGLVEIEKQKTVKITKQQQVSFARLLGKSIKSTHPIS